MPDLRFLQCSGYSALLQQKRNSEWFVFSSHDDNELLIWGWRIKPVQILFWLECCRVTSKGTFALLDVIVCCGSADHMETDFRVWVTHSQLTLWRPIPQSQKIGFQDKDRISEEPPKSVIHAMCFLSLRPLWKFQGAPPVRKLRVASHSSHAAGRCGNQSFQIDSKLSLSCIKVVSV